jgi:hypothetical protein
MRTIAHCCTALGFLGLFSSTVCVLVGFHQIDTTFNMLHLEQQHTLVLEESSHSENHITLEDTYDRGTQDLFNAVLVNLASIVAFGTGVILYSIRD